MATPSSGDVRYLVIRDDDSLIERSSHPRPLAARLTRSNRCRSRETRPFNSCLVASQRATGDDATKLRAIRSARTPARASAPAYDSTPVVGADGVPAALYARDAAPFESENGLIPVGVF